MLAIPAAPFDAEKCSLQVKWDGVRAWRRVSCPATRFLCQVQVFPGWLKTPKETTSDLLGQISESPKFHAGLP
jgi:hypothetical protein